MHIPQQIGKYQVRRELGRGAMGIVHQAFDPAIEREVAIKVLNTGPMVGTSADELRSRFRREAQAAGRLSHAHIVAIYDYGDGFVHDDGKPGSPYIVMEMVRGQTLKDVLDRGVRPPLPDTVRWMGQLLAALHHAHERGVVHRDIKPANVMLLDSGELKVADFGIARVDASDLTGTGAMLGTVSYMSPEQLLGQAVDRRADIYACGVLLYLLLTGELPFLGSTATVMQRVLNQDALPPSKLNRTLSPAWDAVLMRALAKQPAARYATAADFARAIEAAAHASDHEATVVERRVPDELLPAAPAPLLRASRGMAWRWATGGMATVILCIGGYRLLQPGMPEGADTAVAAATPARTPALTPALSPTNEPAPASASAPKIAAPPATTAAPPPSAVPTPNEPRVALAQTTTGNAPRGMVARTQAPSESVELTQALTSGLDGRQAQASPPRMASSSTRQAPASKPAAAPASAAATSRQPTPAAILGAASSGPAANGDFARTRRECEALAATDIGCQRMLGLGYLNGRGGDKDVAKGLAWLRKAADGGDAAAQFSLGWVYLNGNVVQRDDALGSQWIRRSAAQGHTVAINDMGWLMENGRGVSTDLAAAAEWYRKGAEAGLGQSQANYGRVLLDGIGVAKDTAKGRALLLKAVDQNRPDASYVLGLMYEKGKGVPVDRTQAAQWYRKAVARGSLRNGNWDAHAREFLAANP